MAGEILSAHHLALIFGLLGNVVSFLVYLAPLPTFYRIYKKKSTEGFQSIPYAVALFSAMLLLYYAFVKQSDGTMLVTINSIGCTIESIYLITYMIYAPKPAKKYTTKLVMAFNVGLYGLIILSTMYLTQGSKRTKVVGWICGIFSVCVFASPLSVMRLVIKTKSVEFMPFWLSFFLTLCAVMWFLYGLLIKDFFIALPNVLGFVFGIAQMILYIIYKSPKKTEPMKQPAEIKLEEIVAIDMKLAGVVVENVNPDVVEIKPDDDITTTNNSEELPHQVINGMVDGKSVPPAVGSDANV